MKRLIHSIVVAVAAFSCAIAAYGQDAPIAPLVMENPSNLALDQSYHPHFTVIPYKGRSSPAELSAQSAAAKTIPNWSGTATVGGKKYTYFMVGKNPFVKHVPASVSIKTFVVPIVFTFKNKNGVVIGTSDPGAADPTCSPHNTPLKQVLNSPILKNITNFKVGNVNLGSGQFVSLFQRANFHAFTKTGGLNPGYQVNLAPVVTTGAIAITVNNETPQTKHCGKLWVIDLAGWDNLVRTQIFPLLKAQGVGPTTLPIFLFYNVGLFSGRCCALGYHSAFDNPDFGNNFQSYSVVDYDTNDPNLDTIPLAHEVAEWMDDPSGGNPTPPWGHLGQVSACQSNLEVGDPLTGKLIKAIPLNGFTYHVQDLAFISWFYGQKPSIGANGWYSLYGAFKTPAVPCH